MKPALSAVAIFLAVLYPLLFRKLKEKTPPPFPLAATVLLAAGIELFDLLSILKPDQLFLWRKCAFVTEASLAPVALWFSLTYARKGEPGTISLPSRLLVGLAALVTGASIFVPATVLFFSPDFAVEHLLFLEPGGYLFYLFLVGCLVVALINLEMTLLSTSLTARWKIKFETLGAGAVLAMLIFYFSQPILFRVVNLNLAPARTVILAVAAAMMIYSRYTRGNGVRVYVSGQMAYRSVVLLAVAVYVGAFGLTAEGIRRFGDGFHQSLATAAAFLAGLGIAVTFLSETVKRKLRVSIHSNLYRHKFDYRSQWLQFTDRLSASADGEDLLRSIVIGFCETFGMGSGSLFLLHPERDEYRQAAELAMATTETVLPGNQFVEKLRSRQSMLDLRREGETGREGTARIVAGADACFAIPLFLGSAMDGFILLGRPLDRSERYGHEDFDLMKTLAKQASSALLNLRLADQLASTREMAALGKVSAFVMHDLKNLCSSLSLMAQNAEEFIGDAGFQQEMLTSLSATTGKMQSLITRLKALPKKETVERAPVDLLELAQETAALVRGGELQVSGTRTITSGDREELQKVALNLMLNAVEASAGRQPVTVEVGGQDLPFLRVRDEGCGIGDDFFANHLFAPFRTTKTKGLGIGLYHCKQIVEAHGGTIEVKSRQEQGSEFTVWLPPAHSPS